VFSMKLLDGRWSMDGLVEYKKKIPEVLACIGVGSDQMMILSFFIGIL